jgi:predicted glycosyltransferase
MNRGGSLLIVEDERLLSSCLRRHCSALGMDVTIAGSVAEGRGCLDKARFDACLLDMGLPDGDGLSLLADLSVERSIVITATPDPVRFAAAGVRHVIPKPLDLDVVTCVLRKLGLGLGVDPVSERGPSRAAGIFTGTDLGSREVDESGLDPVSRAARRSGKERPLRVMLYSHDTVGLGHFRRNLMIARALSSMSPRPHVLMVSGATEAVRFPKPDGVDVVTLPALAKLDRAQYASRSLGVSLEDLISIRSQTIRAVAASFGPDVLVVDNVPRGAERELDATLEHLRSNTKARIVLGLRDVLDEPEAVARDWARLDNEAAIESYYDAIWVYGDPAVVELGVEYDFSADVRRKIEYVGYLDRRGEPAGARADGDPRSIDPIRGPIARSPYILCLVGGGEDGSRLADAFARVSSVRAGGLNRVLLLGPFMPDESRAEIHRLARTGRGLQVLDFTDDPTLLISGSEAVISMGGHNSISEILSYEKPALIVPRVAPRREQWIRAHRLAGLGVVDVCDPEDLCPERLEDWIEKGADRRRQGAARVDMGGVQRVRELLRAVAGSAASEPRGSLA